MKTSKAILGMLVGVAIGTTLGVLYAPEKGKKTRKKLAYKKQEAKDKLKESFDDFIETASEKYSSLKKDGEDFLKSKKEDLKDSIIMQTKKGLTLYNHGNYSKPYRSCLRKS